MQTTARFVRQIQLVQKIVGKLFCEETSLVALAEDRQRLGRCHVVWQIVSPL